MVSLKRVLVNTDVADAAGFGGIILRKCYVILVNKACLGAAF